MVKWLIEWETPDRDHTCDHTLGYWIGVGIACLFVAMFLVGGICLAKKDMQSKFFEHFTVLTHFTLWGMLMRFPQCIILEIQYTLSQ